MKMYKTPSQIKKQMEFWVLRGKSKPEGIRPVSALESYDLLDAKTKNDILKKVTILDDELIVFVIRNKPDNYILNTTKRFLKITDQTIEQLLYTEFKTIGLNETGTIQNQKLLRIRPKYTNCYLIKRDEQIVTWELPYESVNCFIQASKRCELIGRKYTTR